MSVQAAPLSYAEFQRVDIRVGRIVSEVLTLGLPDGDGEVVLLVPERDVPIGGRMF